MLESRPPEAKKTWDDLLTGALAHLAPVSGAPDTTPDAAQASRNSLLGHSTRRTLFELIQANWGVCESELGRLCALGRNNVKYHLHRLERAKLVDARKQGRKVHYFPRHPQLADLQRAIASSQNVTRRRVLQLLREHPTLSWRAISQMIGITPRAVRWHLHQLSRQGLLEIERVGIHCRIRLSPVLEAVLNR